MLALCWAYVGLCWAYVGPCWAILGTMLGPCLGHLCWNDLKMPIFPPRAPSWSPKPRKNRGFVTSPRWNPLAPKGLKHRKKRCFLTPQATNTVNYRSFSRGGVGRRQGRQRISGQGPAGPGAGHVLAVRQFSPLRRREGPPPCRRPPPPPRTIKISCVLQCFFCCSHFLPFFGSSGSRWVNMGQHRPQDRPT